MYNETVQNADMNGVGFLLGMLWVLALGAAMLAAYIGRRTNERKEQTYGYELEVIKTLHENSADANHSLANFLTKVRGKGGWEAYYAGYTHEVTNRTKIVTDSSLNFGGIELVSPPLHGVKERRRWLSRVAGVLGGLVKVDRSCGVHLHVGLKAPEQSFGDEGAYTYGEARMIAVKTSVLYTVFQNAINQFVPRSRHDQSYTMPARRLLNHAVDQVIGQGHEGQQMWAEYLFAYARETRYFHVNVTSLRKYGTIEFRQHAGSTNIVKLDAWAQLMSAIIARAATISHSEMKAVLKMADTLYHSSTPNDLFHFLGLSPRSKLATYFKRRATELKGLPIEPKCDHCGKESCAGCTPSEVKQTTWDDIHHSPEGESYHDCGNDDCYGCSNGYGRDECEYHMSAFGLGIISLAVAFSPLVAAIALIVNCGIGAIHSRGKQWNGGKVAPALWNELMLRGKQAAGMAWIDSKSVDPTTGQVSTVWYFKRPQPASALLGAVKRLVSKSTHWMMFHTRFATHGDNNEANAHPHFSSCGTITLVHNGVVGNYKRGWHALAKHGRTQADVEAPDVDSQVIAELLAVGGIDMVIKHCVGSMSLIWSDSKDPAGTLHFWTNGENPLHFGRLDNPSGDIMIASTESIWLQAAGKRVITEPQRVVKTRSVKVVSKYNGKPHFRTEQVRDKRGQPVYTSKRVPVNHWSCTIGKHYTISPEGKVDGYITDNYSDTIGRGVMYDWTTYGTGFKATNTKALPTKAEGDADTCAVPAKGAGVVVAQRDLDGVHQIADDTGSWPSFLGVNGDNLHGYCNLTHRGIKPDGERYDLPQWFQPWVDPIDMRELLSGEQWLVGQDSKYDLNELYEEGYDLTGF